MRCLRIPESTPSSHNIPLLNIYLRPSQNIPFPPRIYLFFHCYMRPSQNLPLSLSIYPLLNIYILPSQNLPLPPAIYPPLFHDYVRCHRIPKCTPSSHNIPTLKLLYATLPEYTSPSQNLPPFPLLYATSQNLPLPPRIYPLLYKVTLSESTLPSLPPSQNVPPAPPSFKHLYATLPEFTPLSQNIPPFFTTMCDTSII